MRRLPQRGVEEPTAAAREALKRLATLWRLRA